MIGKTLGHYQITNEIGKGGMGEVYQARDKRLGRDVAIKVLPEEFARDTDRVARFQREAKLLASLNHPNIAAIHGLEESEGTDFLVLELVEGETLADRVKAGPIPVEESLKLALQIAEALEAAHEKGVIHRDLKPQNIKVTPEGKVKVLDFGLAKAYAGDKGEVNLSNSPTLSDAPTQQGVILGTAAYMSPEQARGKAVDKRADIWAFGCVLYEMLTGHVAFSGKDVTDILAAVIRSEPEWNSLPANLHWRLREVLERCLKKDARDRYHDIADVRVDIQKVLADPGGLLAQPGIAAAPARELRPGLPWIAAIVVFSAIIAGVAAWKLKPAEPRQVMRFEYELPEGQQLSQGSSPMVVSPDGKHFVYGTPKGLYLRSMDELTAKFIAGSEGETEQPFFSPDGKWIGYFSASDRKLKKIAVNGGTPVTLCDVRDLVDASWGADNTIAYVSYPGNVIMRVPADGGTPESLIKSKSGPLLSPQILPDRKSVLYYALASPTQMKVMLQSLKSGEPRELFAGRRAKYVPTGHIIYMPPDKNNVFAVPFDLDTLEVKGRPIPVLEDAQSVSISDTGTLIYVPASGIRGRILVWVDRSGKEEIIDAPPRAYVSARLAPDGTRAALSILDEENDIWIWDLARKRLSRLTFDPGLNRSPVWTPDGKRVAFSAEREGAENIYWQAADGSGVAEPLTRIPNAFIVPKAFSPDCKQLLFTEGMSPFHLQIINLDGRSEARILFGTAFSSPNSQFSPDGHWLAYDSNESGSMEIYVRPFPDVNAGHWQISSEGGMCPLWSANGRELFYYVDPGTIMSVPVETGTSFKAGVPKVVFKGDYPAPTAILQYSVTRDGKRFLMIKNAPAKSDKSGQRINIILNWFEELKQRVPVK